MPDRRTFTASVAGTYHFLSFGTPHLVAECGPHCASYLELPEGATVVSCDASPAEYAVGEMPGLIEAPANMTDEQIAEIQAAWNEAMQDPAAHQLVILGESQEDRDRRAWESTVRCKLDSALLALANGLDFAWDHPYEYATTWCPICGAEMLLAAPEEHERACSTKLAGHQFTGLLGVMRDGATYGGSNEAKLEAKVPEDLVWPAGLPKPRSYDYPTGGGGD